MHKLRSQKRPILLLQGEADPRIPRELHSDLVAAELQRYNLPGTYITFGDEGHGISSEANSLYMYYQIERFLTRHLLQNAIVVNEELRLEHDDEEALPVWVHGHTATIRINMAYKNNNREDSVANKESVPTQTLFHSSESYENSSSVKKDKEL